MKDLFFSVYIQICMALELIINAAVFMVPLEKRRGFWLRLLLGSVLCLMLRYWTPRIGSITLLLTVANVTALVFFCCNVSIWDCAYCAVCAYAIQHFIFCGREILLFLQDAPIQEAPDVPTLGYIAMYAAVLAASYFGCVRKLADGKRYNIDVRRTLIFTVMVVAVVMVLSIASQQAYVEDARALYVICRCYAAFCCLFLLVSEVNAVNRSRLTKEVNTQQMLLKLQKEQYQLTKEKIELINRKCHDLKRQIGLLRNGSPDDDRNREITQIEDSIQVYDATLHTGNEVLDVVLTQKSLDCESLHISMTCVADGKHLGFMDTTDLFAIFCNAMDNAIEAVQGLQDQDKRMIAVSVWERSGLALFQFENYFENRLEMVDSIPVTTKKDKDFHGFGMKSIQYAVQKYNGQMSIHTENNIFVLRISIPVQQ